MWHPDNPPYVAQFAESVDLFPRSTGSHNRFAHSGSWQPGIRPNADYPEWPGTSADYGGAATGAAYQVFTYDFSRAELPPPELSAPQVSHGSSTHDSSEASSRTCAVPHSLKDRLYQAPLYINAAALDADRRLSTEEGTAQLSGHLKKFYKYWESIRAQGNTPWMVDLAMYNGKASVKVPLCLQAATHASRCPTDFRLFYNFSARNCVHLQVLPQPRVTATNLESTRTGVLRIICNGQLGKGSSPTDRQDASHNGKLCCTLCAVWFSTEGAILKEANANNPTVAMPQNRCVESLRDVRDAFGRDAIWVLWSWKMYLRPTAWGKPQHVAAGRIFGRWCLEERARDSAVR